MLHIQASDYPRWLAGFQAAVAGELPPLQAESAWREGYRAGLIRWRATAARERVQKRQGQRAGLKLVPRG